MKYLNHKSVRIGKKTIIDNISKFEGKNVISDGSIVKKSYFGYASYTGTNCEIYNTKIGKYSCIGPNVTIIIGSHPINFVSVHPVFYSTKMQVGFSYVDKNYYDEYKYADIEKHYSVIIGNDVWIGANCKILEGVTIGNGSIIAAGAVVAKDVEPYSIVGGVPAKTIKYRFNKENIDFLNKLEWWNMDYSWLKKYSVYFNDIDKLKEAIKNE